MVRVENSVKFVKFADSNQKEEIGGEMMAIGGVVIGMLDMDISVGPEKSLGSFSKTFFYDFYVFVKSILSVWDWSRTSDFERKRL